MFKIITINIYIYNLNMLRLRIILIIFIPLMITLLLTIVIPILFILIANPQEQQIYKSMKIKSEQILSRTLFNSDRQIFHNGFQIYTDIRNCLIQIYLNSNQTYQTYNNVTIYSPNTNATQGIYHSVWNTNNNAINSTQQSILNNFNGVQVYMQALIGNNTSILNSVQWVFAEGIIFTYPFSSNINVNNAFNIYFETLNNSKNLNQTYTTYNLGNSIIMICDVFASQNTLCFTYNGTNLFNPNVFPSNIRNSNYINQISLLQVTTSISNPFLIFNYDLTSNDITFPPVNTIYTTIQSNFSNFQSIFQSSWLYNYSYRLLYLYEFQQFALYQIPIEIFSYSGQNQNLFNMLAISSQLNLDFTFTFTSNNYLTMILTPLALFTFCSLISLFILSKILNKLLKQINFLVTKTNSLINGDLQIQIPDYTGTKQIQKIYEICKTLNYLCKFSNPTYFKGNNSQKSIKYFTALGIFKKLENKKSIGFIYENLAGLAAEQMEFEKAINYYKQSLSIIQFDICAKLKYNSIRQLYIELNDSNKKIPRNMRKLQIILMRRSFNLIETMFKYIQANKYKDESAIEEIIIQIQILMHIFYLKQNQPRQALLALIRAEIWINIRNLLKVQQNFDIVQQIYTEYERVFLKNRLKFKIPPEIIVQYLKYLKGLFQQIKQNYLQALNYFILSFDGDNYDPTIRQKSLISIKRILIAQNIYTFAIKNSVFFSPKNNQQKEFIFLVDFSKSVQIGIQSRVTNSVVSIKKKVIVDQIIRIYDNYIRQKDRVSLIKFSSEIEIVFNLTQKGRSSKILRQSIQSLKEQQLSGRTALYSSMKVVLSTIKKLKRHKILIILLDGADNCSRTTAKQIKEMLTQISQITLLILGIDLEEYTVQSLQSMISQCKRGYVVNIQDSDDIDRILKTKDFIKKFVETYIC